MVTSLLTLYAMAKVWNRAFWRPIADAPEPTEKTRTMPKPMLATAAVLVLVGIRIRTGPIYQDFAEGSAADLVGSHAYVDAVLPRGSDEPGTAPPRTHRPSSY